ncbi:hypothetical protein B7486_78165, partial [cyanobacterium TDX16]
MIPRRLLLVTLPFVLAGALVACSSDESSSSSDGSEATEAASTSDDSTPGGAPTDEDASSSEPEPCDPARPVPAGQTREALVVDG